MLEGYKKKGLSMHSVLVMRRGEIVAEAYAEPFDENSLHRMYSSSKSFVSLAIGLLESEGKISLEDTIDKYFPEQVNESTDRRIAKACIVDLLRMASPYIKVASCRNLCKDDPNAEGLVEKAIAEALAKFKAMPIFKAELPATIELTYYRTDMCESALAKSTCNPVRIDARTLQKTITRIETYNDLKF
jgi:CubicO group peptidase (beta-lactamase class C family)